MNSVGDTNIQTVLNTNRVLGFYEVVEVSAEFVTNGI